jgi:hypothetical protein
MALERFDGVRGAAWIIAARRGQQGPERYLVAANEKDEELAHGQSYVVVPWLVTTSAEVAGSTTVARHRCSCASARSMSAVNASNVAR